MSLKQKLYSKNLLEELAELEHEQWIEWSKAIAPEINTAYFMPHLERWKKCWVPYSKLSESDKEHDRKWARKILAILVGKKGSKAMRKSEIWFCGSPRKRRYSFGYWCSGPESLAGDGLLCYVDVKDLPERVREKYLSRIYANPLVAMLSFLWLNINEKIYRKPEH